MGTTLSEGDLKHMREIALRVIEGSPKEDEQGEVAIEPPVSFRKIRARKGQPSHEAILKKTSAEKKVREQRGTSRKKNKKTGTDFLHESHSGATFFGVTFYQFLVLLFLLLILILNAIWLNMYSLLG